MTEAYAAGTGESSPSPSAAADFTADLFSVRGITAVVTGGTRGIGLMIARGLLQAGAAHVVISSRKADACAAAEAELAAYGSVQAVPADLSTREGVQTLTAALHGLDRIDLLVNNAGATWGVPLDEWDTHGWDRVLDINVKGVFALTQALLPQLRASATADIPARVINIGSIDGLRTPTMETYSYSASKAAVHMLTRHLAKRLADEHITVNAIAPGPFESKMMAFALNDQQIRGQIESDVPLHRIGRPDDVVGLTILLASRAGAYLTGTVIPLDGGITGCNRG